MSERPPDEARSGTGTKSVTADSRKFQVGIQTLVLLTAAIGVWIAHFNNRQRIATLEKRIKGVQGLAHVLLIPDPQKISVVKLDELWHDDHRWDLSLPEGSYRVCLATRGIDEDGLPLATQSGPIGPGHHRLQLEQNGTRTGWRITVSLDRNPLLSVDEPRDWNPNSGSSGGGQFSKSEQLEPERPVVLFRRRFALPRTNGSWSLPNGPVDGIMLWIERSAGPPLKP